MKRTILPIYLCAIIGTAFTSSRAAEVTNSEQYKAPGTNRTIFKGRVELPSGGIWAADGHEHYLIPDEAAMRHNEGKRAARQEIKLMLDRSKYALRTIITPAKSYARTHGYLGPKTISELDEKKYSWAVRRFKEGPTKQDASKGSFGFLIPDVRFNFADENRDVLRKDRTMLAFERQPYIDDGKYWVLYTDGSTERVEIDTALVEEHGQEILPVRPKQVKNAHIPEIFPYTIITSQSAEAEPAVSISLTNFHTGETLDLLWDRSAAKPGGNNLKIELNTVRSQIWAKHYEQSESSTLATWLKAIKEAPRTQRGRGQTSSVFGVMGGRAAVRETLQMQSIGTGSGAPLDRTVPIASLEGVNVKSHPFEDMLDGNPGGNLPLANTVPADHFFLYIAKPASMLALLDDGADFMSHLGGSITDSSIKYYLKDKYLARMGLNEDWLRSILKTGAISECAVIAPDLFFIDGTEIAVISRLASPTVITPLLKMIGAGDISEGKTLELKTGDGHSVFWSQHGDLLLISTNQTLLENSVALKKAKGVGSLGQSAEFRYMLTQLPINKESRLYAYISDSFIRNLVGPKTKIAQLRRMLARGQMELLTSAALLAKAEGYADPTSLQTLKANTMIPAMVAETEYHLDANGVAHSIVYGTLNDLSPLDPQALDLVTQDEANQYKQYVDRYNRFWRGFFDPIAVRLDEVEGNALEASLFILPLIDNSMYNGLKQFIMSKEDGSPLRTPTLTPTPVMMLSMNIREQMWTEIAGEMATTFTRYAGLSPALLDDLGPAVHLAINDADPVIALGSGDILGAFGSSGGMLTGRSQTFMIPFALSILTRPCTLMVETENPETTRRLLRQASIQWMHSGRQNDSDLTTDFYQIEDQDSWVYTMNIFGMVKLRYGLEVTDDFLVIRNIPWSPKSTVTSIENGALNGSHLLLFPGACNLELPGLHASAAEQQAAVSLKGASLLYPLLFSGQATMESAAAEHLKLFGFTPDHPGNGHWSWQNNEVISNQFGSITKRKRSAYKEGVTDFGLMKDIGSISLQLQFEDTGLRTKIRWTQRTNEVSP